MFAILYETYEKRNETNGPFRENVERRPSHREESPAHSVN